jgi:hypothetical protein
VVERTARRQWLSTLVLRKQQLDARWKSENVPSPWDSHRNPIAVPVMGSHSGRRVDSEVRGRKLPGEKDTDQANGGVCQDERRR